MKIIIFGYFTDVNTGPKRIAHREPQFFPADLLRVSDPVDEAQPAEARRYCACKRQLNCKDNDSQKNSLESRVMKDCDVEHPGGAGVLVGAVACQTSDPQREDERAYGIEQSFCLHHVQQLMFRQADCLEHAQFVPAGVDAVDHGVDQVHNADCPQDHEKGVACKADKGHGSLPGVQKFFVCVQYE